MPTILLVLLLGVSLLTTGWLMVRYFAVRQRTRERVFAAASSEEL